jgi:dicarboxylate transporter 10
MSHAATICSITNYCRQSQVAKQAVAGESGAEVSFVQRVGMAALAGAVGGMVGTPADMVNVRMQNDSKLPVDQRRK